MGFSNARTAGFTSFSTRAGRRISLTALFVILGSQGLQQANAVGETRTISLHHMHTKEELTITYKRNGRYDEDALKKINWIMRDWRKEQDVKMDPHAIDLLWEVQQEVGAKAPIHIVCGYRSPSTNAMLRSRSKGVARISQHMAGKAIDFYIPGVPIEQVRNAGLRLQGGGVGYYPSSGVAFVHLDVGSVRHWPRMSREQLARVFPNGRTVHVPTDGAPLSGYELALADLERGQTQRPQTKPRSLFAAIFSGKQDSEEADDDAAEQQQQQQQRPAPVPAERPAAVAPKRPVVTAAAAPEPQQPAIPLPQERPSAKIVAAEARQAAAEAARIAAVEAKAAAEAARVAAAEEARIAAAETERVEQARAAAAAEAARVAAAETKATAEAKIAQAKAAAEAKVAQAKATAEAKVAQAKAAAEAKATAEAARIAEAKAAAEAKKAAFQIASAESRLVPVPEPRQTIPNWAVSPGPTPNEIISSRIAWDDLLTNKKPVAPVPQPQAVASADMATPANVSAARRVPAVTRQAPAAAADVTSRVPEQPSSANMTTASVGPFLRPAVPDSALSYASYVETPSTTSDRNRRAGGLVSRAAATPATTAARPYPPSVAVKPTTATARAAELAERMNNPWLRSLVQVASVQDSMIMTLIGEPDYRMLVAYMRKPESAVMMTFSADPHLGMTADQFTGSAVVFQATVTFGMRTAALR